jgi:hypothetical protein
MKLSVIQMLCVIALSSAIGVAYADKGKDESGKGRERGRYSYEKDWNDKKDWERGRDRHDEHWEADEPGSYFHEHGYTHLDIPPGHYPPLGECRIWFPDRPPGHQPPPGDCSHVPPGAWVIETVKVLSSPILYNKPIIQPSCQPYNHVISSLSAGIKSAARNVVAALY